MELNWTWVEKMIRTGFMLIWRRRFNDLVGFIGCDPQTGIESESA